ncbi:auxin-responsive protein SAUR72-like [Diospyros lotus]|uniref:auxin-responsive protein SAUR72-like n=1 Tax=Diospyros lotus TaxID=55363 RepID=UPI0022561FAC|nr:auxin-responsive protein SAUR72-like [Diospyros lotus]
MEVGINGKTKKGLIIKTWERCRSIGRHSGKSASSRLIRRALMLKSRSWSGFRPSEDGEKRARRRQVVPEGCFSVYVGPQKQRFVIKTEYANHPLFKMLLEEAELEYGYNSSGPLALPCNVDVFYKVLLEMDSDTSARQGCSFAKGHSSYRLLPPSPLADLNNF